jgi:2-polyprenyl-3-methyl-5-hydroxy-6-metoxy-1,4-benzoquinol methylase
VTDPVTPEQSGPERDAAETSREFYDAFLESRMLGYRVGNNPRIRKAGQRVLQYVDPDSHVLELGCGIGIVTERVAKQAKRGHVLACDLGERNIWYAQQTISQANVEFLACDVLTEFATIRSRIVKPVDVVVLVDVIEHLPASSHGELFQHLRSVAAPNAVAVLTYPSPFYQRFLQQNKPAELQPIDEVIEPAVLVAHAEAAGFFLCHYSLESVWLTRQYVHCVFGRDLDCEGIVEPRPLRIAKRVSAYIDRTRHPFRRRKYVDAVFGRRPEDPPPESSEETRDESPGKRRGY